MADIEYERVDGVGVIRLNRPKRKNAFTLDMADRWADLLIAARTDPEIRALVLTGAGDAFCAGVDIERRNEGMPATALARKQVLSDRVHRIPFAMEDLDKPVIAAINGVAVGAGLDMALMCDLRIMARSARLSEGYIRLGLVPGDGGCYYLPRLVGVARALELLLTGDFIDSVEADRIGLVNRVVDDDDVFDTAMTLAHKIAAAPPVAIRMIKRATYQSLRGDLRTSLDLISSHTGVIGLMNDSGEAMAAFRDKRAGTYTGT